jgi:DNA-repair protein complementing XP-A cells
LGTIVTPILGRETVKMALTEEQKERIEENRKRALEIRQQKQLEREIQTSNAESHISSMNKMGGFISTADESGQHKKMKANNDEVKEGPKQSMHRQITDKKGGSNLNNNTPIEDEESLEDFEQNASEYITKTEAQKMYCLPMGTLAVCSYTERDNPHRKGWSSMKLYSRSEVRRRARKRFGGKAGLIEEREKRKEKRLEKDLEEMKDVFR